MIVVPHLADGGSSRDVGDFADALILPDKHRDFGARSRCHTFHGHPRSDGALPPFDHRPKMLGAQERALQTGETVYQMIREARRLNG